GAVIVDARGKILVRNEEAMRLWQGRDELLDRFTHRALSENNGAREEEIQLSSYDGVKWLRVATAAIHDHKGRVFAGVVTCYDLTELKRAEATLRVAEKVAVTGRLAATIAHEINNPLAAVTNLLYLTKASPSLPADVREFIIIAQQELSRVAHIVKQTLSFYQTDATPIEVEVSELIDSAISICANQAETRGVRIVKDFMPVKRIKVYANEVRQLVCNILLNGIEAAKHAVNIRVYESHDWRDPLVDGVRISIADDGPGIPRESRDQIFEPFFTTKGIKGTGLGLWVGRNIVQKHGGEIHVKSSHWTGYSITCFSVFLPYEVVERARSVNSVLPEPASTKVSA
ncbi:MAG TPA: ATP-binding protein, partial [Terriglobales bacterium]